MGWRAEGRQLTRWGLFGTYQRGASRADNAIALIKIAGKPGGRPPVTGRDHWRRYEVAPKSRRAYLRLEYHIPCAA